MNTSMLRPSWRLLELLALFCLLPLFCAGRYAHAAETIPVYSYYDFPPFVVKKDKGLSYDLVDYLNRANKGAIRFELKLLPKPQIDALLARPDAKSILLLSSPTWVKPEWGKNLQWSMPIIEDASVILSRNTSRIEYTGPASLRGLRFCAIAGQVYVGIDDMAARHELTRIEVPDERAMMRMLAEGKADAGSIALSSAAFLSIEMGLSDEIYIAPTPLNSYSRHLMLSGLAPEIKEALDYTIASMPLDPSWQATLAKYRVTGPSRNGETLLADAGIKRLSVGFVTDKPPFSFEDTNGIHTGIEIDVMRFALTAMGLTMERSQLPNSRTNWAAKSGAVDITVSVQGEDGEGIYFSDPAFEYHNIVVSRKAAKIRVDSLADLQAHSFVIWQDGWRHLGPKFEATYKPDANGHFPANYNQAKSQDAQSRMFWGKRTELIVVDKSIFEYYRRTLRKEFNTAVDLNYHDIFKTPTFFSVAFRDSKLRDRFNKVLKQMRADGTYQVILNRYK
jgi:polar amino acid transport system substrate-binding protein